MALQAGVAARSRTTGPRSRPSASLPGGRRPTRTRTRSGSVLRRSCRSWRTAESGMTAPAAGGGRGRRARATRLRPCPGPECCPASSRPPTRSTSAIISARSASGWRCRNPRRVLLRRRPARDHGAAGPGAAAPPVQGRGSAAARGRARPEAVHGVRAEPRPRARRAGLGLSLHDRVRRGQPDGPVQGQVGQKSGADAGQRGAVHLPDPAGRRHPAVPVEPGAGGRGPAAAPGADPGSWRSGSTTGSARRSSCPGRTSSSDVAKITDLQDPSIKMSKSASAPQGIVDVLEDPASIRKKISGR